MKKRIDSDKLKIGMFVCGLDRSWMDTPFLRHKFTIREEAQLEKLRSLCRQVVIDTERGLDCAPEPAIEVPPRVQAEHPAPAAPEPPGAAPIEPLPEEQESLQRELGRASLAHRQATDVLDQVLDDVRLGRSVDTQRSRQAVKELTASVVRNPNALLCLTQLKDRDRYTSQHSVNVCIFTLAFARHIGIPKEKILDLGLGALLHDIGKMRVPQKVLNKPGPLTDGEFTQMKRHPELAMEILAGLPGVTSTTMDVVLSHHERIDGSGYPAGLKGKEISLFARMVAIVDVYDAITSARVYHDPVSPLEALQRLYQWRYKDYDNRLVEKFIQCLGVYPAGSLVELDSGEVGVVLAVHREKRTEPVVKLLLDSAKRPLEPGEVVDLHHQRGPVRAVSKVLDPLAWQRELGSMWEQELQAVTAA